MGGTLTWLHLSDIHFRPGNLRNDQSAALKKILGAVQQTQDDLGHRPDLVFVTGDIAFQGQPGSYLHCSRFLTDLIGGLGLTGEHLFIVPGNHDVDSSSVTRAHLDVARKLVESKPDQINAVLADPAKRDYYFQRQNAYLEFALKFPLFAARPPEMLAWGDFAAPPLVSTRAGRAVRILALNSAWISCPTFDGHPSSEHPVWKDEANLLIGGLQYKRSLPPGINAAGPGTPEMVTICLTHHPTEFLVQSDRNDIEDFFAKNNVYHLYGHTHRAHAHASTTPGGSFVSICSGAAYGEASDPDSSFRNQFNVVCLDFERQVGSLVVREWDANEANGGEWIRVYPKHSQPHSCFFSWPLRRDPAVNPFHPFLPFVNSESEQFRALGRDSEIQQVLSAIHDPASRLLVIFGPSGVGKTSLIQAGILPRLLEKRPELKIQSIDAAQLGDVANDVIGHRPEARRPGDASTPDLVIVLDQFEKYMALPPERQEAAAAALRALLNQERVKVLLAVRNEFYYRLDSDVLHRGIIPLSAKDLRFRFPLELLKPAQAKKCILGIGGDGVWRDVVDDLVAALESEPGAGVNPLHLQLVCSSLWDTARLEKKQSTVTPDLVRADVLRNELGAFLTRQMKLLSPTLVTKADALLWALIQQREHRTVARPVLRMRDLMREPELREDLEMVTHVLSNLGLIVTGVEPGTGEATLQIPHDLLAEAVLDRHREDYLKVAEKANSLLHMLSSMLSLPRVREDVLFAAMADFLDESLLPAYLALKERDQTDISDELLPSTKPASGILEQLSKSNDSVAPRERLWRIRIFVDVLAQLRLLLRGRAESSARFLESLDAQLRKLSIDGEELAAILVPYRTPYDASWLAIVHDASRIEKSDEPLLRSILERAQEGALVPLSEMVQSYQASLAAMAARSSSPPPIASRLPLWRLLVFLWREGQADTPVWEKEIPPRLGSVLRSTWKIVPEDRFLESYKARRDERTYQGVIVHIPAGEHARRTQRTAKELLLRTVAIESEERATSPGWKEADRGILVPNYDNASLQHALGIVADSYTGILNRDTTAVPANGAPSVQCSGGARLWIVLEAQEYGIDRMIGLARELQNASKSLSDAAKQRILIDSSCLIANRKDVTRALVHTLATRERPLIVRQPDFRVIQSQPDEKFQPLFDQLHRDGLLTRLYSSSDPNGSSPLPADWEAAVKRAVAELGGNVILKPVTTEFLKGSTPFESSSDPVALERFVQQAWERGSGFPGFPSVVVEKTVTLIDRELLVIAVQRSQSGDFVDVPPVWYQCNRELEWHTDRGGIPYAFDYAWTESASEEKYSKAFAEARNLSYEIAKSVWAELERMKLPTLNRFLEFEWFLDNAGTLYLNELKPTQLDKGIVTHYAFDYSDTDLFVRNLFGYPLPAQVCRDRSQKVTLTGSLLVRKQSNQKLLGYEGIEQALKAVDRLDLYSDKLRSRPYVGRRMGTLTVSDSSLEAAERRLETARKQLKPVYPK